MRTAWKRLSGGGASVVVMLLVVAGGWRGDGCGEKDGGCRGERTRRRQCDQAPVGNTGSLIEAAAMVAL